MIPQEDRVKMIEEFGKQREKFSNSEFAAPTYTQFPGSYCDLIMVEHEGSPHIIYQWFPKFVKHVWPAKPEDVADMIGDLYEEYFVDTTPFLIDYVPEMDSWAVRASFVRTTPNFKRERYVENFASYVHNVLQQLAR